MQNRVKSAIKGIAAKATGINSVQEQIDTLYYFLNSYIDICKLPPATGDLRALQICDAAMLRLFDAICNNQGLQYWLDYGTLLGAARHKGFIPWDDDLDVSMERKQWNRAAEVIPPILESIGFYVCVYSESWFGFGYKRNQTGLWMDVFCYETYMDDGDQNLSQLQEVIHEQLTIARRFNTFNVHPKISRDQMRKYRINSAYSELTDRNGNAHLFLSPEIEDQLSHIVFDQDDIFPLDHLEFEGHMMPVPNNWKKVLAACYGDWHQFQRSGVLHHGIKGTPLKDLARINGVDMHKVEQNLVNIQTDIAGETI